MNNSDVYDNNNYNQPNGGFPAIYIKRTISDTKRSFNNGEKITDKDLHMYLFLDDTDKKNKKNKDDKNNKDKNNNYTLTTVSNRTVSIEDLLKKRREERDR